MNENLEQVVIDRVKECFAHARTMYELGQKDIEINFDKKGRVAGTASWQRVSGHIKYSLNFNYQLAGENLDEYLKQVIPHEVSHIIDYILHPGQEHGHGFNWKMIMVECFGLHPDRCHSMDTSNCSRRVSKNQEYKCLACGKRYTITTALHNKVISKERRISCRCGTSIGLHYVGESVPTI